MGHTAPVVISPRTNISMFSLKWGEVLSTVLPGAVAVLAIAPYFPDLWDHIKNLDKAGLSTGIGLLVGAAIAGGVLEGVTRIGWEQILRRVKPPFPMLHKLTTDNLELYERGVQSSYKYVTFYANLGTAGALLLGSYAQNSHNRLSIVVWGLGAVILILFGASYVQWTYYVNYVTNVFGKTNIRITDA